MIPKGPRLYGKVENPSEGGTALVPIQDWWILVEKVLGHDKGLEAKKRATPWKPVEDE